MREFTGLRFYEAFHDQVLCYGKWDERAEDYLLFHVLIDPHAPAEFAFEVPLWEFGLPDVASIEVEDAIHGNRIHLARQGADAAARPVRAALRDLAPAAAGGAALRSLVPAHRNRPLRTGCARRAAAR